ncbi:MAG: helix-turn-helix domain-containing protein, partial [Clostridiales bacterium]|nr:helix-turn-helix domain-containing protein [Clostridiales bacterium]MBS5794969.1 helix-turn-helix domain-containing protein [Clostridiales bacterium]
MKISLRAARVNADLTQQEVADKIGVSKHTII